MTQHTYKSARARYLRRFWPLMAIYVAVVLAGAVYSRMVEVEPQWVKAAFGIAMGLPIAAMFFVMVRFAEEADEYVRLMQLRAFAYGTAFTLGAAGIIGALQMFDTIGYVEVFWFVPGFFFAYGLSYLFMGGKDCA